MILTGVEIVVLAAFIWWCAGPLHQKMMGRKK